MNQTESRTDRPTTGRAPPMRPGEYLARRRKAAHLFRADLARILATMSWSPFSLVDRYEDHRVIAALLSEVEQGRTLLTLPQVEQLRHCFRFDPDIYLRLVDLEAAGAGAGLPVPQLCRDCGCSWHDPCLELASSSAAVGDRTTGPCHWVAEDLCSRCERLRQAQAELASSALREPDGVPA